MKRILAFDFGASSGRAILATYESGQLAYREVHRFENNPRQIAGHFRWDFENLMANVHLGIQKAGTFDSIGFDTWGVDFGLLDADGHLLEDPVHYRDQRTDGIVQYVLKSMTAEQLYAATGNQIMPINTLFQLLAVQRQNPQLWGQAHKLLFMPDLFVHALCGAEVCETTIASTSQMLDAETQDWSQAVLDQFDIPKSLFAKRVDSGSIVGEYKGAKVISVAGHDTQCAIAAMPSPDQDAAQQVVLSIILGNAVLGFRRPYRFADYFYVTFRGQFLAALVQVAVYQRLQKFYGARSVAKPVEKVHGDAFFIILNAEKVAVIFQRIYLLEQNTVIGKRPGGQFVLIEIVSEKALSQLYGKGGEARQNIFQSRFQVVAVDEILHFGGESENRHGSGGTAHRINIRGVIHSIPL